MKQITNKGTSCHQSGTGSNNVERIPVMAIMNRRYTVKCFSHQIGNA
jgi:hypothetical protein